MPPHKIGSAYSCCTSREPPSPDGLSPRATISPIKLLQRSPNAVSRYSGASTTSVHVVEVRKAIFDSDKEDSTAANDHDRGDRTPEVKSILGKGSAEGNTVKRPVKPRNSLSSLNLKAVAQKLRKCLSRDAALNKRHSRASIGTSEEEIERRAELRRIRQKRIQEELINEGIYDTDAKFLVSITGTPSPVDVQTSWIAGDLLSLPVSKAPALLPPTLSLPEVKYFKKQEYYFHNYHIPKNPDSIFIPKRHPNSSRAMMESNETVSRRHSSPILLDSDFGFADPRVYVPLRKQSSIATIPLTPNIEPQRLPSFAEPTISSWRLSFTSTNRAEHLRKLSRDLTEPSHFPIPWLADIPPRPSSKCALTPGLISTGQQLLVAQEINLGFGTSSNHSRKYPESESCRDAGDVDGPKDSPHAIPLYEMGISRQLASRGLQSSSSSPQLSSWGSHQHSAPNTNSISTNKRLQRSHDLTQSDNSIPLSERIPHSWGQIARDGGSSSYPSISNSIQLLPCNSQPSILPPSWTDEDICNIGVARGTPNQGNQQFPLVLAEGCVGSSASLSLPNPTVQADEECGACLVLPSTRYARRSTIDNSSILASETDSFREREAELLVVQARFASVDAQRVPGTPKSSKFQEEFHLESPYIKVKEGIRSKPSEHCRSKKPASQSYDGENAMADLLAVPLPDFDLQSSPRRSPGTTGLLDDMSELNAVWGKAVKSIADDRAGQVASHLHVPRKNSGLRNPESRKKGPTNGTFGRLSWKKGSKSKVDELENTTAEYQKRFQEQLVVREAAMDDWEAEMDASAQKAKAKSRSIVQKTKSPNESDRRFPLSWSRYPSHSRDERTLSAGPSECIESRDFATRTNKEGQRVFHTCREAGDIHLHEDHPDWHKNEGEMMGLRAKLGDKFSQKLYRLETRGGGSKAFEFQTDGRRGSMRIAAKLAFPELKLLPVRSSSAEEEAAKIEEQNQATLRKERRLIMAKLAAYGDGSADDESKDGQGPKFPTADLHISIADPRFYDDCVVVDPDIDDSEQATSVFMEVRNNETRTQKGGCKTWHGGGWHKYRPNRRSFFVGTMALGKGTDDYCSDLDGADNLEKHKVLQIGKGA